MPSFQDSAFLVLIALLLFGPKGLAKLAREIGKLMGEFRRASNEFRLQMEDEFRQVEQAERQQKIEAIEAAAPVPAAFDPIPEPEHPHMPSGLLPAAEEEADPANLDPHSEPIAPEITTPEPIATAGDLNLMPPATGLPTGRSSSSSSSSSLSGVFDSIPHTPDSAPTPAPEPTPTEVHNG